MNGCTFQGKLLCHFLFCLAIKFGSTLKGKNLLVEEHIFSHKSLYLLEGVQCPGKQTTSHKSCFPLNKKNTEKVDVFP